MARYECTVIITIEADSLEQAHELLQYAMEPVDGWEFANANGEAWLNCEPQLHRIPE